MIEELRAVVLARSVPDFGLEPGDLGTVVHAYRDGEAYEVEFMTGDGNTVAVLTLESTEIRRLRDEEILHARRIGAA